jgi:zinc transport system substrate-binding protein
VYTRDGETIAKMNVKAWVLAGCLVSLQAGSALAKEPPVVVASIKPVHSLIADIMQGVGTPHLLVKGGGSPHSYSLKPSDARLLEEAAVVFWVGEGLESFLVRPVATLAKDAQVVALSETEGLTLLPYREGGAWEGHDDEAHGDHGDEAHGDHDDHDDEAHGDHGDEEHAHHDDEEHGDHGDEEHGGHDHDAKDQDHHEDEHAHGALDMHLWLDPANAAAIVEASVTVLTEVDPERAERYRSNGKALVARLRSLDTELSTTLAPVTDKPYIVFHDAYQYFERRYGLAAVGSITVSPDQAPGAARLSEMRHKLEETGAICVFAEPQFEPRVARTVLEGSSARLGVLDPLGADLPSGPSAYPTLMRNLAASLSSCLLGES